MKKRVIFVLCLFLTLGVSKMMANSINEVETSPVVSYAINLGDVSELSAETLETIVNEAATSFASETARCSVTATVSVGVVSVSITVEDDCDKVVESAKKAIAKAKAVAKALL
jgi:hypothetical protein